MGYIAIHQSRQPGQPIIKTSTRPRLFLRPWNSTTQTLAYRRRTDSEQVLHGQALCETGPQPPLLSNLSFHCNNSKHLSLISNPSSHKILRGSVHTSIQSPWTFGTRTKPKAPRWIRLSPFRCCRPSRNLSTKISFQQTTRSLNSLASPT
jgi:hypothetical protein